MTAKARLDLVKSLFVWGWEMRLCEMPRNLPRYTRFNLPRPAVKTFSVEEVQALWEAAGRRLRCYMVLALNTAMGSKDISDLRIDELDRDERYITRGRSKTGVMGRCRLWPITLDLISAEGPRRRGLIGNLIPRRRSRWPWGLGERGRSTPARSSGPALFGA